MNKKMPGPAAVPLDLVGAMNVLATPAPATSAQPMLEGAATPATPDAGGQNVQPLLPKAEDPTA